jgi:hypothetical protein
MPYQLQRLYKVEDDYGPWVYRYLDGSDYGLFEGTSPFIHLETEENHENPEVMTAHYFTRIQTMYIPNTNVECYCWPVDLVSVT